MLLGSGEDLFGGKSPYCEWTDYNENTDIVSNRYNKSRDSFISVKRWSWSSYTLSSSDVMCQGPLLYYSELNHFRP